MSDEKNGGSNNVFVTSHNQSGGITAHTVNVGLAARLVDENLIRQINETIPKGSIVNVNAVLGDQEAFGFASKILAWLRNNGYKNTKNEHGVDQAMYNQPIPPLSLKVISGTEFELNVGSRQ